MHPLLMSALISGGINALQGKRGSNLLKSTVKDTLMSAALMGGTNLAMGQPANPFAKDFAFMGVNQPVVDSPVTKAGIMEQMQTMPIGASELPSKTPSFSESITSFTDVFKDKPGGKYDAGKVAIGAGGAALAGLGLGAFDPTPPEKPKIPGYNKFYAADPSMFMPYDDPDIAPIDYGKYPEEPYSNMNQGGIASFDNGGLVGLKKKIEELKKTPEGLRELGTMIPGSVTEFKMKNQNESAFSTNEEIIQRYIDSQTMGIKAGGIASFDEGGPVRNINIDPAEIFKKVMMEGYRPTPEEKEALDKYLAGQENKKGGGIMQLAMGGRASNEPIESIEETTVEEETTPAPQGLPRIPFMDPNMPITTPMPGMGDVMGMKTGALVDKLPSMSNTDENNPKNYKRTSGKLVVDAAGKGSEEKDTMLAQLADGEFVTKSKAVRGAGIALGASPKDKKQQRELGARFFYKQMADFDKLAKRMAS
tara:strand:- start:191 stop:1624 length:1434 start_codon:yes stop_codon:yes gene_type:complete